MTRLYEKYKNELVSQLQSKLKIRNIMAVSYTHLDVYKRQRPDSAYHHG